MAHLKIFFSNLGSFWKTRGTIGLFLYFLLFGLSLAFSLAAFHIRPLNWIPILSRQYAFPRGDLQVVLL